MMGKHRGLEPAARRLVLCALFGSVLIVFAGCEAGPRPPSPAPPITPVTADPTEAQLLTQLQVKWENPQVHYELARLYHKSQNWLKAEGSYGNALGFDPAHKAAQAGFVKLFIDRGEPGKAEQIANSYVSEAARTSVRETLRLGWEFKQLKLDDYTLRCFRQALEAEPTSFEANKQIGFYYLEKRDTAKAKQYLMRSFELNPRQPEVAGALGKLGVVVKLPETPAEPAPAKPK